QMGFGIEQFHGFYRGVFREIMKIQVGLDEGGLAERASERALERLGGPITSWLYEAGSGSLRELMRNAAEILLRPVAEGEICDEPLPDLFPEIEWVPPPPPISRAP